MKNLYFKQLLVLSNTQKSGNQFKFSKRYNLITANDNSVGKSTLAKLLFWVFGAEPELDKTWTNTDSKILLDFEIDEHEYTIIRDKNIFYLKDKNGIQKYTKVSGDFSEKIADIVNFKVLLTDRSEEEKPVVPPPAYYFLPFYIDQQKSWTEAWNGFNKLEQFASWKQNIVKYHIGLLTPKHFELEQEKYEKIKDIKILKEEVEKIGYALSVISDHVPQNAIAIDEQKFEVMKNEIKTELLQLANNEEDYLKKLAIAMSDKAFLEHQKITAEKLMKELDADYKFSVENIENEKLECPLCGTYHENSIVNRASILVDKQQSMSQLKSINDNLETLHKKIETLKQKSIEIKDKINELNLKYSVEQDTTQINLNEVIQNFAYKSINQNINETKKGKLSTISDNEKDKKDINKEQKKLIKKEDIEKINSSFVELLNVYIKILNAEGINLSDVKTPLDYNKLTDGGAAENTRGMLAYYLAIFTLIDIYGNEVKAPLIIDTPNQHEQATKNYEKIFNLVMTKTDKDKQIIICAMNNEHLAEYANEANIITLDSNKLLDKSKYEKIKTIFDEIEKEG
jgi:DNA repair exonuclease SbcCD ATPase subunit